MGDEKKGILVIKKVSVGKIKGYARWEEIPLCTNTTIIGRASKSLYKKPPHIIIVDNHYISREQAEIRYSPSEDCLMIRDLGSKNGTFVNGKRLEGDRKYRLKDNALIELAKVDGEPTVVFRFLRSSEETLKAPAKEETRKTAAAKEQLFLDRDQRMLRINGSEIYLTKKQFQVLEVLYDNRGKACSIDDISNGAWGEDGATNDLIAHYIGIIRKKIEPDPSKPHYITTIPGRQGCYRLVC
jgi:pSer/pThr/pTyr-binding forkhead associated (FHA) protein